MISSTVKKVAIGAIVSFLALSGASASMAGPVAASKVTVDLPNNPVAGGESAAVPMMLTGFTFDQLSVTLSVEAGTLTVADAGSLLTLSPGYDSLAGQTEISFHGATADVVAAMETGVNWTAPGDAATETALSIRVQVGEYQVGTTYDPATGHSYKFVSAPLNWESAKAAAAALTYKGKSGYLTSITSAEENTFIANKSGAINVWIGATADLRMVNFALTAASKPTITVDPQPLGNYYWSGGSETGIQFSSGLTTVSPVAGLYNSWATGEPNNWPGTGEACGVTNWSGSKGSWNDLDCGSVHAYLVEFDTAASDFETSVVTFDNITGDGVDAVPAVDEAMPEDTKTLAATGFDAALLLALALALIAAGAVVVVRARKN